MAKPRKVEDPAGNYASAKRAEKSAAPGVRYAKTEDVKKIADKIFAERKELFRKLAQ